MSFRPRFSGFAVALAALVLVTGCFTGIESTPRIGADEVRRNQAATPSPEKLFLNVVKAEAPRLWRPGQTRFRVDSMAHVGRIFTPASAPAAAMVGRTLTFGGFDTAVSLTGDSLAEVRLVDAEGHTYFYRSTFPVSALDTLQRLDIPFMVNVGEVAAVDSMLRGRRLYVRSSLWYDRYGMGVRGFRHVEVIVDSVVIGYSAYPAAVYFSLADSALVREAGIEATDRRMMRMTLGTSTAASRNFDKLFYFENPRKRYPDIAEANWDLIVRGRVAEGMTRDECRLALGTPDEVLRVPTRGGMRESWTYQDGIYLVFDDGFLTHFRQ